MFTWDEEKNRRNIIKHGVDFAAVLPLFTLPEALVTEDRRKDYSEPRFILICPYKGVHLHITFTRRDEFIRLISARRANKRERRGYEQRKHN